MPPKKVRKDLKSTAYRKAREQMLREETHCWICGHAVNLNAEPRSPFAPSADHVLSPRDGGDPVSRQNLRLAHVSCNSSKGRRKHAKVPKRARLL